MTRLASQDPARRRELSQREAIFNVMQRLGGLIAGQVLHLDGPLQENSLRAALDVLQHRFPLLCANTVYGGFRFTRELPFIWRRAYFDLDGTDVIPLRVVSDAEPADLDDILQSELSTRVGGGRLPGMRVTLVQYRGGDTSDIVMVMNHAVADLPAQSRFANDLLRCLAGTLAADDDPPQPKLPPPLEDRYPLKPKPRDASYLGAIRLPQEHGRRGRRTTPYLRFRLSESETRTIKQACASQKTSLHGAVAAAFLNAIGSAFNMRRLTLVHSLELRRMCVPPVPARTFGCYIDLVRTVHDLDGPFWQLAKGIKSSLVKTLVRQDNARSVLRMPDLKVAWAERKALVNGLVDDCMAITAVGELPFAQSYGELKLRDITNIVSMNRSTTSFFVVVGEWNDALSITVSYCSPIIRRQEAEDVADKALSMLREHCA